MPRWSVLNMFARAWGNTTFVRLNCPASIRQRSQSYFLARDLISLHMNHTTSNVYSKDWVVTCLPAMMQQSRVWMLQSALDQCDHLTLRELYGLMKSKVPPALVELCLWGLLSRAALGHSDPHLIWHFSTLKHYFLCYFTCFFSPWM